MNFATPIAFIGLISIPIIIAMYLFKQKYREVNISSLYLWQKIIQSQDSRTSWQKLKMSLIILLQILCAALLVFAMSGPYLTDNLKVKDYIFVLDCSMSMQAKRDGSKTRFDSAKAELVKLVEGLEPSARTSFVVMSNRPYIAEAQSTEKQNAINVIKSIKPSFAPADLETTQELVRTLYAQSSGSVYVFTDRDFDFGDVPANKFISGESADNTAITLLSHSIDSDRIVALAKVKNFGTVKTSNSVAVYTDSQIAEIKEISLAPGEEKDVFFLSLPRNAKNIMVKLSADDSLSYDNTAYDFVGDSATQKVIVFTKQNVFLENMLEIIPNIELYRGDAKAMENLTGYYLYVFDGVLPEKMPTDGNILIFNPPAGNSFIETKDDKEVSIITVEDDTHLNFISEMDMSIQKAKVISAPSWSTTVLKSKDMPLVLTGSLNSRKVAVFAFDLHNTDLPLKKEFPIFMYNLTKWLVPSGVFSADKIVSGDEVEFNVSPDSSEVKVVLPDNSTVKLAPPFPAAALTNTSLPGVYILEQLTQNRTMYSGFAVNVAAGSESDLKTDIASGFHLTDGVTKADLGNRSLVPFFILGLILVLAVEWWVYSRGF